MENIYNKTNNTHNNNYFYFRGIKIISLEYDILYKLESNQDTSIPDYDLVIMDESESLLNHFRSETIKEKEKTFDLMKNIIFNSKKLQLFNFLT